MINSAGPEIFASERFIENAQKAEVTAIRFASERAQQVIKLAHFHPIPHLGAVILRAPGEGIQRAHYYSINQSDGTTALAVSNTPTTEADIEEALGEERTVPITLRRARPAEPSLARSLYQAATKWRHPSQPRLSGVDQELQMGLLSGTGMGLAWAVIQSPALEHLDKALAYPVGDYLWSTGIGAACGVTFGTALFHGMRQKIHASQVERLRPFEVTYAQAS